MAKIKMVASESAEVVPAEVDLKVSAVKEKFHSYLDRVHPGSWKVTFTSVARTPSSVYFRVNVYFRTIRQSNVVDLVEIKHSYFVRLSDGGDVISCSPSLPVV